MTTAPDFGDGASRDERRMRRAMALAATVRSLTSPNPWVGCIVETPDGRTFEGVTAPPGGSHAETAAIAAARTAGATIDGATAWVTLEPCGHHGRTPPCAHALVAAGIRRVVVGIEDPDARVRGTGIAALRDAGVEVEVGVLAADITSQLAPYLKHRRTGKPWVVLKLGCSLDGRTAAPNGTSQWITGAAARADAHRLRAEMDAVLVGAGTVRADDPALTVRAVPGRDPQRVVLGAAPPGARVMPAWEVSGEPDAVLDDLGTRGVLSLLVEGGATVAHEFHQAGLVDRYVVYLAPALFGGDDAAPMFRGPGAPTIADIWRGRIVDVTPLGADLRVELEPATARA